MNGSILIIGAGSIGRRHAQNARALNLSVVICDPNNERAKKIANEIGALDYYTDYRDVFIKNQNIVAAIIASPSCFHAEQATFLANKGVHLFIEKPLATEVAGLDSLAKVVKKKKIVVMMGQSYRFHEGYILLKKMLQDRIIGKLYHVDFSSGQHLPDWHPTMDYRVEYTAQKKLGGGALFTNMSHIFDSLIWLFGDIEDLTGWKAKISNLEIDVDDCVFCLIKTKQNIIIKCRTDFLQNIPDHKMDIFGDGGSIQVDFLKHRFFVQHIGVKDLKLSSYMFEPNRRYVSELEYFIFLIKNNTIEHDLDIYAGTKIVKLLLDKRIKMLI